jgi:hypothetical protein
MGEVTRRFCASREVLEPSDLAFLEAPTSTANTARHCAEVPTSKLVSCLENGLAPTFPPADQAAMGFTVAASSPPSLLTSPIKAMGGALARLKGGALLSGAGPLPTSAAQPALMDIVLARGACGSNSYRVAFGFLLRVLH